MLLPIFVVINVKLKPIEPVVNNTMKVYLNAN